MSDLTQVLRALLRIQKLVLNPEHMRWVRVSAADIVQLLISDADVCGRAIDTLWLICIVMFRGMSCMMRSVTNELFCRQAATTRLKHASLAVVLPCRFVTSSSAVETSKVVLFYVMPGNFRNSTFDTTGETFFKSLIFIIFFPIFATIIFYVFSRQYREADSVGLPQWFVGSLSVHACVVAGVPSTRLLRRCLTPPSSWTSSWRTSPETEDITNLSKATSQR